MGFEDEVKIKKNGDKKYYAIIEKRIEPFLTLTKNEGQYNYLVNPQEINSFSEFTMEKLRKKFVGWRTNKFFQLFTIAGKGSESICKKKGFLRTLTTILARMLYRRAIKDNNYYKPKNGDDYSIVAESRHGSTLVYAIEFLANDSEKTYVGYSGNANLLVLNSYSIQNKAKKSDKNSQIVNIIQRSERRKKTWGEFTK